MQTSQAVKCSSKVSPSPRLPPANRVLPFWHRCTLHWYSQHSENAPTICVITTRLYLDTNMKGHLNLLVCKYVHWQAILRIFDSQWCLIRLLSTSMKVNVKIGELSRLWAAMRGCSEPSRPGNTRQHDPSSITAPAHSADIIVTSRFLGRNPCRGFLLNGWFSSGINEQSRG